MASYLFSRLSEGAAMSHSSASSPTVSAAVSTPLFRWLVLLGLLIGEVLLLTLRFDTGTLRGQSGWWAELLGESNLLLRLVIAVVAATLLLGGASMWDNIRRLHVQPVSFRTTGTPLIAHLLAFIAFAGVTAMLLEGNVPILSKPVWTVCSLGNLVRIFGA
jgi:hypothetical protein